MKALILVGKSKGQEVEVLRWTGGAFQIQKPDEKPIYMSAISLAFKDFDFSKLPSSVFADFERKSSAPWAGEFMWTFRPIKVRVKRL